MLCLHLCPQALTIAIFTSFIYAEYVSRAAEVGAMQGHGGQGDDATLWVLVLARALWHAPASHPALLLLAALQAPLLVAALIMAGRMGFGIAANVTVNEMVNRFRYSYLNHELAGYCNRFDRGVGPNCVQFWAPPRSAGRNGRYFRGIDWWSEFEAGERTMQASNSTLVRKWSLTLTIRALDAWRRRRRLLGK